MTVSVNFVNVARVTKTLSCLNSYTEYNVDYRFYISGTVKSVLACMRLAARLLLRYYCTFSLALDIDLQPSKVQTCWRELLPIERHPDVLYRSLREVRCVAANPATICVVRS